MDPAAIGLLGAAIGLLGVVIGSISGFVASFLRDLYASHREDKRWLRQQEADEKRHSMEEQAAEKSQVRQFYQKCISSLSLFIAEGEQEIEMGADEKRRQFQTAQKWLSLLSLHRRDSFSARESKFRNGLYWFTERPDSVRARRLLAEVIDLVNTDGVLFPDAVFDAEEPNKRTVQIQIQEEFRKEQFHQGGEVSAVQQFKCDLAVLTPGQRQRLWDMYQGSPRNIPQRIELRVPHFHQANKSIRLIEWEARLNPLVTEPIAIFHAWELDYDKAHQLAQNEQSASMQSAGSSK